jgi:DNA-binding NtrC family response regulator
MAREPDAAEAPTRSHVLADVPADVGPRAVVLWEGGQVAVGLPERGRVVVGRSKTCDLQVDHASVSRTHVALHVATSREGALELDVEDLGSSNGTRINGVRMPSRGTVRTAPGDVVELGSAILVVQRAGSGASVHPGAPRPAPARAAGPVIASEAMTRVYRMVDLVAPSRIGVLIVGETGVGKELLAEALHRRSPRSGGPFVAVNCAALPESLLESEMFGFDRGAFTGATSAKPGLLEATSGGTVFLDEVGEMPLATQAKLLRAIESGEIMRLGSLKPRPIDVRFLAATNRPLAELVDRGAFRRDLYYRLDGITLRLPPLRERREEIAPLARSIAAAFSAQHGAAPPAIAADALALLGRYDFPGNVRELKNAIERACLLCGFGTIGPAHLRLEGDGPSAAPSAPSAAGGAQPAGPASVPPGSGLRGEIEAIERERILAALDKTNGNQTQAAALLGIARRTLVNRMEAWGLPRPRKR